MRNLPALTGTKIDGLEVAKSVKTKVAEIVKDLKLKEGIIINHNHHQY